MKRLWWLWPLILLMGCSIPDQNLMPMAKGNKWSYRVQGAFDSRVDDVSVGRSVAVGGVRGWELVGDLGTTTLAWSGQTLVASEICGQRFDPPIPLYAPKSVTWKGTVETAGRTYPGDATLGVSRAKEKFAGKPVTAVTSTLSLTLRKQKVVLTSTFLDGVGLLHQEQRTGDRRDRYMEYLSGP